MYSKTVVEILDLWSWSDLVVWDLCSIQLSRNGQTGSYLTLNGTVDTSGEESSWCAGWSKVDNSQNLSWGTGESNVVWASWHKGLNTVLHHTTGVCQHMNTWQRRCCKCSDNSPGLQQLCISLLRHGLQMMLSTEILQQLNATCTSHIAKQQSWNTLASKRMNFV